MDEGDGAVVVNAGLGERFSGGLFIVHDGLNDPEVLVGRRRIGKRQHEPNFKFVPWERVAGAFDPPLTVYPQTSARS